MKGKKNNSLFKNCSCVIFIILFINLVFSVSQSAGNQERTEEIDFTEFQKILETQKNSEAIPIGDMIFASLEKKYSGDTGFRAFQSKLKAADFLANQMQQHLKKATNSQILSFTSGLFKEDNTVKQGIQASIAPAKSFYDTSLKLFTIPIRIDNLKDEEKKFLAQYYNLKLMILVNSIAKTGQALSVAKPDFEGTHDYVLVLPLLHVSDQKSVNIDIFPRWMQQPEQLDILVDSCLLHFGLPYHAMNIAKKAAQLRNIPFSEIDFYKSSSEKCGTSKSHIAVDCLQKAINLADENGPDEIISIKFDIVQLWIDSSNYSLAASEAHKIFETYPENKESGKAIWLYFYALSRANSIDEILANIDSAIDDKRCEVYQAKLMYIKWWALRRDRNEAAAIAALEYQLLKKYDNDPMVAPILLSRATDLLASQDYTGAYGILTQLVAKFPTTAAANQAKRMLEKLSTIK